MLDLYGLSGQTAIVIGGTGVLGGAMADALGAAGAHVIIVGRSEERGTAAVKKITDAGGSAEFLAADSTKRDDLEQIVEHL
ncbi:MAG: SDR family NAD(P)-dependent oxidoreductase, partial [Planctomycetaceae bacterium]|nr:SDR family NAD(P)-dependent oxidoreductase [Planctomycetaceae bacterium]